MLIFTTQGLKPNMFKTLRDKSNRSGTMVLGIGIALLIFTFASACIFLTESLQTMAAHDFGQIFEQP
jgi:hypothetical protein